MKKNSVRWAKKQWQLVERFTNERRELERVAEAMESALAIKPPSGWWADLLTNPNDSSKIVVDQIQIRDGAYLCGLDVVRRSATSLLLTAKSLWNGNFATLVGAFVFSTESPWLSRYVELDKPMSVMPGTAIHLEFQVDFS